ncbi:hypothetical protein ACFSJY_15225 [Thalassotalea euphylliae]|uniref:hypothetical protein n=1 Tax=Thalassotalea euphylliae TaxID=1655234 RepID=UPI003642927B
MKRTIALFPILMALSSLAFSANSKAGVYTDQLSMCLVNSTSVEDRNQLVRWMFAAASNHPAVSSIANVTPEALDQANQKMGELMMRLLTVSCKKEASEALKYEGAQTMEASFEVLGNVAGREMFSSPLVAESLAGLDKYIDSEAIQALVE